MLGVLWSFPPLDFFLPLAFLFSSAFFALSNASFNLCSSACAFFNCKAMSLEFFGLVASSVEEDASDEEVLGLLFLFFLVLGAVLEVTAFGVVGLEMSEAVDLEPHDLLDEVDLVDLLDLLDEVLGLVTVVVTGFPPEPELQGTMLGASTLCTLMEVYP